MYMYMWLTLALATIMVSLYKLLCYIDLFGHVQRVIEYMFDSIESLYTYIVFF